MFDMNLKIQSAFLLILLLECEFNALEYDANKDVVVSTKLGQVRGLLMKTRLGKTIKAFRGLFYAEPPTGQMRFEDAIPVRPWNNIFDATKEGPACPQAVGINLSENCLTLNIYTKEINQNAEKLPVIVFVYPGGFSEGSSQSIIYGPRYLLDHDIILVTINYRLSSLGFLSTGDYHASGNYGFKDQILALRFIRDHIASFGGDPNSVTLTGQSAGSCSIVLHLVSPLSRGLFHRAIGMSGSMIVPIPAQREQIKLAKKQARLLNCTTETLDEMFQCLMRKPANAYGDSVPSFKEWYKNPTIIWYPSIEPQLPGVERFLYADPEELMKAGKINQIPLIFGVTKDEFGFLAASGIKDAMEGNNKMFQDLNERWYELAPICFGYERNTSRSKFISNELYKFYFGKQSISVNNSDTLRLLFANALVHFLAHKAASLISKYSSSPVYFYEFTYQGRYSFRVWPDSRKPNGGVAHCDDLQYIFDSENDVYHPDAIIPFYNDNDPEIITVMRLTTLWAHFAKTGEPLPKNPDLYGNTSWERFTPETKSYLNMGKDFVMENDFMREEMRLWHSLFP